VIGISAVISLLIVVEMVFVRNVKHQEGLRNITERFRAKQHGMGNGGVTLLYVLDIIVKHVLEKNRKIDNNLPLKTGILIS